MYIIFSEAAPGALIVKYTSFLLCSEDVCIRTESKRGLVMWYLPSAGLMGYNPMDVKMSHADIWPQSSFPMIPSGPVE